MPETNGATGGVRARQLTWGHSAASLERVFELFVQAHGRDVRSQAGLGIGLSLARSFVEMHGGRLWVESSGVPGEGATFIIELPAADADSPPEGQAQ